MIGQALGPYRIEALLGRGGMGAVYRALDTRSGEKIALKVIASEAALDRQASERFEQEAELLASLQHRNVVAARGSLSSDGERAYYAMELVLGRSLSALLSERGKLEPEAAIAVALELLSGLEAAHAQGVIHRDVKPSNVLLGRDGSVKIVDFGLARALDATRLTISGQALGTPAYMSPEQANAQPVDARTDVYSAGVLLWELLVGKPPFAAAAPLALLRLHVEAPVPPLPVSAPAGVEGVLRQALAKDPSRRFETAGRFASALEALSVVKDRSAVLAALAGASETTELPALAPVAATAPWAPPAAVEDARASALTKALAPANPEKVVGRNRRLMFVAFLLASILASLSGRFIVDVVPSLFKREIPTPAPALVELETADGPVRGELISLVGSEAVVQRPDGTTSRIARDRILRITYR